MKKIHIHVGVEDLNQSIGFYSVLFGEQPTKVKDDYANWSLEDPRMNFAISTVCANSGLEHLGIQVDTSEELEAIRDRLEAAGEARFAEGETTCCYSESEKSWVKDPNGVAWESFKTTAEADGYFGNIADNNISDPTQEMPCC